MADELVSKVEKNKYKLILELPTNDDLKQIMQDAESYCAEIEKIKPDFWNKTSASMKYILEILNCSEEKNIDEFKEKIIGNHKNAWQVEGSANKQNAIKEDSEFVICMLKKNKDRLKEINHIDKKIKVLQSLIAELG